MAAPTQAQFLDTGLETCTTCTPGLEGATCSIRTEDFESTDETVVRLMPCEACYFHKDCILTWFTSMHGRCGTCPNDRTVLFSLDRIEQFDFDSQQLQSQDWQEGLALENLEALVVSQNVGSNPDPIINVWETETRVTMVDRARRSITTLRETQDGIDAARFERRKQLADGIESEVNRLRTRHFNAQRLRILCHASSFSARIRKLRAADQSPAPPMLDSDEKRVQKLVEVVEKSYVNRSVYIVSSRVGFEIKSIDRALCRREARVEGLA